MSLLFNNSHRIEIELAVSASSRFVHVDEHVHHRSVKSSDHASFAVSLDVEPIAFPLSPGRLKNSPLPLRAKHQGESIVLRAIKFPNVAAGDAKDLSHIAKQVTGQIDNVDSNIHQSAPAHDFLIVHPRSFKLGKAGVPAKGANMIQFSD